MRRLTLVMALGLVAVLALSGCSKQPTSTSLGTMNVQMTDAPGDFQHVNLVVNEVAVQQAAGNGGWEVLSSQPRTVDVLTLRNGVFTTLGISQLPAGHYNQLRLKLGFGSNVVVDNTMHPLRVPSGLQSGFKIAGSFDVPPQGRVDLGLDFDCARSIVANGDGSYSLDPVVRCVLMNVPDAKPGGVHGVVAPSGVMASVFVIANNDTIASTLTGGDGQFTVALLPAGTYSVAVHAKAGYQDQTVAGVVVAQGQTTDVGTVTLSPIPPPPPTQGAISGQTLPSGAATAVSAMASGLLVAQVSPGLDGAFTVDGLPPGSYSLQFTPASGYQASTLDGVSVQAGATTNVGAVTLQPVPPPPPSTGSITGFVAPAGMPTMVSAMQGGAVVASTQVDGTGYFFLGSLPVGTYDVLLHPAFDFNDKTVSGVSVTGGATTNLGTVSL